MQLVDGLDHPEGVAFDPLTGCVYAGGEDGQVYRVDLEGRTFEEVARAPGFVLGLAVDGVSRLVLCVSGNGSVCAVDDGQIVSLLAEVDGEPLILPNYPAFGSDGSLFFSDSGDWAANNGRVVRVDRDGQSEVFSRALDRFPNGCAVSRNGKWLWMVESFAPTLSRFDLGGASSRPELVARLDGTVPDGLALTSEGGVLVSCYRPDCIYYLAPDGTLEVVAQDPQGTLLSAPTNVCFVGEQLDRVVSANLGRWHLTLLDLGLIGDAPHTPERWALDAFLSLR
jgi:gluconolactonase